MILHYSIQHSSATRQHKIKMPLMTLKAVKEWKRKKKLAEEGGRLSDGTNILRKPEPRFKASFMRDKRKLLNTRNLVDEDQEFVDIQPDPANFKALKGNKNFVDLNIYVCFIANSICLTQLLE